jgi:carbon monoxide dehydrogenase subunit G
MIIEDAFEVPVPVAEAWSTLLDLPRVVPCLPGASLESADGDEFTGRVKVKLGPIQLTYAGTGRFLERDDVAHRAVIEGVGKDVRGGGTAKALVTATMLDKGDYTEVSVVTDFTVTGKPAQFGRGIMQDVSTRLLNQFSANLSDQLTQERTPEAGPVAAAPAAGLSEPAPAARPGLTDGSRPVAARGGSAGELNLVRVVGPALVKRLVPVVAAAMAALALVIMLRRRSRRGGAA